MKYIVLISLFICGCSILPSKWDENQARVITDIRQQISSFDCNQNQLPQIVEIEKKIEWFNYYSEFKDTPDLESMMNTLQTTTQEYINRLGTGQVSLSYCEVKKQIMLNQVGIIGSTIKGS